MKVRVLVAAIGIIAVSSANAGEQLSIKVTPSVAFAPTDVVVRATIEASPDNRAMQIVAESGDFFRSSEVQLDGDRAPRVTTMSFRGLPGGEYTVGVTLRGPDGEPRAHVGRQIQVISSGRER